VALATLHPDCMSHKLCEPLQLEIKDIFPWDKPPSEQQWLNYNAIKEFSANGIAAAV